MRGTNIWIFLVCIVIGISACAVKNRDYTVNLPPITYYKQTNIDENAFWQDIELKEIFGRYWRLCFDGRYKETWLLEAPYFRAMVPEVKYNGYIKGYLNSELIAIEIWGLEKESDNFFTVRCEISFERGGEKKDLFYDDHWVKVEGQWYHVIRNPILFPGAL